LEALSATLIVQCLPGKRARDRDRDRDRGRGPRKDPHPHCTNSLTACGRAVCASVLRNRYKNIELLFLSVVFTSLSRYFLFSSHTDTYILINK
jgi:hypothetical protein